MSGAGGQVTVFLIDDHTLFRAALRSLIEADERFRVVGDTGDPRQGIERIEELRPDVVVLDITMPGLSGLDAIPPIKKASPSSKVLIASQHEGHGFVRQALQTGADGYLPKSSEPAELHLAIDSVQRGDPYLSPRVTGALVEDAVGGKRGDARGPSPLQALTPREREVFQLVAIGKANKEIAATLELSLGTVKKHRENLQRKLRVRSAAEIARLAIREGLLGP